MGFRRTTLPSGATIVTECMQEVRSVSVGLWFDVGARDEPDQLAGTSHFLEHLLFKGTPTRTAKDIADAFDAVGGDINAFTGKEYTCYYARVLNDDLGMALDVLADMIMNSTLDSKELESERKVILEEIAMHEDAPDELVHDLFFRSMWHDHPLGRPVLGSNETVSRVTRDEVASYWRERYSPPNLVVAAAGAVDHDELSDRVRELFAADLVGRRTLRAGATPDATRGIDIHRRPTEQAHIIVGTEGLHRNHPDRHALTLLDTVLGGGMSSRLFQEIREKRGLAYAVYSYRSLFADAGTFAVYAGTTPQNAHTVMDIIRAELESMATRGITEAELERAKGHLRGSLVLSSEDPGSRMNRLGRQQITNGEILSVDELIARFDALEMSDIKRVAESVLGGLRLHVTVVGPFDQDAFDSYARVIITVGVIGARGRMGSVTCDAVANDDDLELVARVGRNESLEALTEARVNVAVDFTTPDAVKSNVLWCVERGINVVVGTTGLSADDLRDIDAACRREPERASAVFVAPNFAIGAVLMMRFAALAAPHFTRAEIVERHHDNKLDAPSGTALRTAAEMNEARQHGWLAAGRAAKVPGSRGGDVSGIAIHSLRLPGSVAHQEVILGAPGETLTIRHDSIDRISFMPGVILAVKRVAGLTGVTVGLEQLLDEA